MLLRARLEAAAHVLEPDQQGRLDGLCGVYATINGIRLSLWPDLLLKPSERRRLFITGIEALAAARKIGTVVHDGMTAATLRRVSQIIAEAASDMTGFDVALLGAIGSQDGHSHAAALRAMRRQLRAGRPLLITLWGAYNHTTVVSGSSKTRLLLFDSFGMRWVGIRSIAVADGDEGRHEVMVRDVMAVASTP